MIDPASQFGEDHETIWRLITDKLQEEIPRQSYLTWFKPLEPLSFTDRVLILKIPSRFYYDWIESHYSDHLKRAISATLGQEIEIVYDIDSSKPSPSVSRALKVQETTRSPSFRGMAENSRLNPRYRFDSFIEGDCNRFARAAAMSLADAPGRTPFNPLLIYGGSGLGKTHLMQAIGNHVEENGFARKVLYVTSEQFTTDFIKSIQTRRSESFSRIYRNADVLLLDDVQFFMAKDKTQEEFFHTFNSLHQAGKQLVFSSDRSPNDLESFDERLISRLQWGLVAELRLPEYETRLAILKNFASDEKIELPDDIAHFLAIHVTDNVRSLQSALIHMLAQSSLIGRRITMELARDAIKNLGKQVFREMTVEQIQDVVARTLGVPADLLRSKTRKREVVFARQVAMHLAIEFTRLTLKAIGLHFGGRDHATVIHARDNIEQIIKRDHKKAELLADLRHKLELASL